MTLSQQKLLQSVTTELLTGGSYSIGVVVEIAI